MSMSSALHFCCILILHINLLRHLPARVILGWEFYKDDQKNKAKDTNKLERNACNDYLFS